MLQYLYHEPRYDSVESAALEVQLLLVSASDALLTTKLQQHVSIVSRMYKHSLPRA
jgi:cellobiose-specific phosphotransferase system component IIA